MLIQTVINSGMNSLANKPLAASNVLLNWSQVRFRQHVEFRKYNQPKTHRQKLLLAVCEPVKAIDRRPPAERCFNLTPHPTPPDHPYDVLLAKDLQQELATSPLVCLFHQNQIQGPQLRLVTNEFTHEGMVLRLYNKDIVRIGTRDTKFEPLLHFATCYFYTFLFAPDTTKIAKIIRIAKKYPELLLMGAMIDQRRLLTLKQLEQVAKMPDLDMQRALLCNTLNTAQQGLLQTMNYHSSELSRMLNSHAQPSSSEQPPEASSTPATTEETAKQD